MSNTQLHLNAADGFKKTGANVALDGSEDHLICREAGEAWHALGMRAKLDREIERVREEYRAGRLRWTHEDVKSLINKYPVHKKVDDVLERLGDHAFDDGREEGQPYWGDDEEKIEPDTNVCGEEAEDDSEVEVEETQPTAVAVVEPTSATAVAVRKNTGASLGLSDLQAEQLEQSNNLLDAYERAAESLQELGAMKSVVHLQTEIQLERRRQRHVAKTDSAMADAMHMLRDQKRQEEERQRALALQLNRQVAEYQTVSSKTQEATRLLKKRKAEIAELERVLETKSYMKRFSLEDLGQGKPRSGGASHRKLRHDVLDRMSKLGAGLSFEQRNDWTWFRQHWDDRMADEHGAEWASKMSEWMQEVIQSYESGATNAFSQFVHSETLRVLGNVVRLAVPAPKQALALKNK